MARGEGRALVVGLKQFDSRYYGSNGTDGCQGCELDVDNMTGLLVAEGHSVMTLKTRRATASQVLDCLRFAARVTTADDIFVFYYSGHGGYQRDNDGDEEDGRDETLCTYDRPIVDDELAEIWSQFPRGARILMISDSCHSGTVYRMAVRSADNTPLDLGVSIRGAERSTRDEMKASLLHFSGCRDAGTSAGYRSGGAFTLALCNAWNGGAFKGDYDRFHSDICDLLRRSRVAQASQFKQWGPKTKRFRKQRPFAIQADLTAPDPPSSPLTGLEPGSGLGSDLLADLEALLRSHRSRGNSGS